MARRRQERTGHPGKNKYIDLVRDAVDNIEADNGVSRQKIVDYVTSACGKRGKNVLNAVKLAIIKAVDDGLLVRTSGAGLNGSFRLPADPKPVSYSLVSVTTTNQVQVHESTQRSPRLLETEPNIITVTTTCTKTYEKDPHLKAILKPPGSTTCSGFRVRFSARAPKIKWISPRVRKRGRPKRCN